MTAQPQTLLYLHKVFQTHSNWVAYGVHITVINHQGLHLHELTVYGQALACEYTVLPYMHEWFVCTEHNMHMFRMCWPYYIPKEWHILYKSGCTTISMTFGAETVFL